MPPPWKHSRPGWVGFEQPAPVGGVLAYSRGLELRSLPAQTTGMEMEILQWERDFWLVKRELLKPRLPCLKATDSCNPVQ